MTSPLERLLAEFWERHEAGEEMTIDAFVAAHAEHALALRTALATMLHTAALLPAANAPKTIAGYQVQGRLGRGASGEVFAVTGPDGRPLALKRLLPHVASAARARERFQREARILGELHHPGIVAIVDVGEDLDGGGLPFLVMERVDSMPLGAWIERARTEGRDAAASALAGTGSCWQRIARLGAAMAEALAVAHEVGVLHRDLKPGNVLLRRDGTPVLIDFGLAADAAAATLTGTGDVLGTPHYMAPEQARGEVARPASDIHALGAILYELLTLAPPRSGTDPMQVLDAARRRSPPSPRSVVPSTPRELDLIVRRAMAFRMHHRHATARELASDLHLVAEGGRPLGLTLRTGLRLDEFWRRRRVLVLTLTTTAVLLVVGFFVRGTWVEARAARIGAASIAATEAHFDGDEATVRDQTATVALGGDRVLVSLLRGEVASGTTNDFATAMQAGRALLPGDPKAAMRAFEQAVAARPGCAIAVGWLGIAAARAGVFDVAERELLSAVRSLPDSVMLRTELSRVLRHDRVRKAAAAVPHMRHAVALPRATAETWHELARALSKDKQDDAALVAVERALQSADGTARTSTMRTKALLLDALKRYDEAIPLLRSILEVSPSSDSWTSYGAMLDKTHRLRDAADAYRQALDLTPTHGPALLNLAYLHTGSDRENCAACRTCFADDPGLLDREQGEAFALRLLRAQEGSFQSIETVAGYLRRVDGGRALLAAIEERLGRDLPAEPLGRLLRAKKLLQRE